MVFLNVCLQFNPRRSHTLEQCFRYLIEKVIVGLRPRTHVLPQFRYRR
jgi:hypothetical protein